MTYDCNELMDLLVDYLEDDLDDEQTAHLERHLELCPPCVNFLESYKKTGELCRRALRREMPAELKTNLMSFLDKKCRCQSDD